MTMLLYLISQLRYRINKLSKVDRRYIDQSRLIEWTDRMEIYVQMCKESKEQDATDNGDPTAQN